MPVISFVPSLARAISSNNFTSAMNIISRTPASEWSRAGEGVSEFLYYLINSRLPSNDIANLAGQIILRGTFSPGSFKDFISHMLQKGNLLAVHNAIENASSQELSAFSQRDAGRVLFHVLDRGVTANSFGSQPSEKASLANLIISKLTVDSASVYQSLKMTLRTSNYQAFKNILSQATKVEIEDFNQDQTGTLVRDIINKLSFSLDQKVDLVQLVLNKTYVCPEHIRDILLDLAVKNEFILVDTILTSSSDQERMLIDQGVRNALQEAGYKSGNDIAKGDEDDNQIFGYAGDDTLYGDNGNDELNGGLGHDILVGDAGDDVLKGNEGNDTLRGGDGNDILYAGSGQDSLTGGAGADVFKFVALNGDNTLDFIHDFNFKQGDKIDISSLTGSLPSFSSLKEFIKWDILSNGVIKLQIDRNGGGDSFEDLTHIKMTEGKNLSLSDFISEYDGYSLDNLKSFDEIIAESNLNKELGRSPETEQNVLFVQENMVDNALENGHNWGGIDTNMYRGADYRGWDRDADKNVNDAETIYVNHTMSTQAIENLINTAASQTTIVFQNGTYVLSQTLQVQRGDITLRGETQDGVIIDASRLKTNADSRDKFAFDINKDSRNQWLGNDDRDGTPKTLQHEVDSEARVIKLINVNGIKSGDFILFEYEGDKTFNSRDIGSERLRSIVEVDSVNAETKEVFLRQKVGIDFDPGRGVTSTEKVLHIPKDNFLSNVIIENFTFKYMDDATYNNTINKKVGAGSVADGYLVNSDEGFNGHSAIYMNGVHESSVNNITVVNGGSNALEVATAFQLNVNNLNLDSSVNLGGEGNGYALYLGDSFYGNFQGIESGANTRHTVLFHFGSSSGFNNIHVADAASNSDFHGGPDYGNIIYFENVDLTPRVNGNREAMEYRLDEEGAYFASKDDMVKINEIQNTVIFDNVETAGIRPGQGDYIIVHDKIYLSANGGNVKSYGGDDIIHSGAGNDIIDTGIGFDDVLFYDNSGLDRLLAFDSTKDQIGLKNNINDTGIRSATDIINDVLEGAIQEGADTIIDLGAGNRIVLENISKTSLDADNFFVF